MYIIDEPRADRDIARFLRQQSAPLIDRVRR
jgi:hypothetical protein